MSGAGTSILVSRSPGRPNVSAVAGATITSTSALSALVVIGVLSGHTLLIPPMAASMALIAGAPSLPLSQPRNVVGGQLISATVGVAVGVLGSSLWLGAVAGGLALGAMLLARMPHSPAAATAVIGVTTVDGPWSFIICAGLGAVVLVLFGVARAVLDRTGYPVYWW